MTTEDIYGDPVLVAEIEDYGAAETAPHATTLISGRTGIETRSAATCGRRRPVQRDHRRNRSQGGRTVASNLQLLCAGCHAWKTSFPTSALLEGWAVRAYGEPAQWPAARWLPTALGTVRLGWVLYDNAGDWREIAPVEAEAILAAA